MQNRAQHWGFWTTCPNAKSTCPKHKWHSSYNLQNDTPEIQIANLKYFYLPNRASGSQAYLPHLIFYLPRASGQCLILSPAELTNSCQRLIFPIRIKRGCPTVQETLTELVWTVSASVTVSTIFRTPPFSPSAIPPSQKTPPTAPRNTPILP